MTEKEKISMIRLMGATNESDNDLLLVAYLKLAGDKILARAYPYKDNMRKVPSKYEMLQCEITTYLLNKRGAEGQTSHSENGIIRQFENADVPSSMLKAVTPYCGVIK